MIGGVGAVAKPERLLSCESKAHMAQRDGGS